MSIFKLDPAFKDYIWGGTRLRDEYGKKCDYDKVAESWELSCHKDGPSVVADGEYKGLTLNEYIEKAGKGVLGKNCERFENFPILIKLIDAKDNLSVQVHPDNDYAMRVEGEYGKTEMWYVVDCEEGAQLIYGFNKSIDKEEFRRRIKDNTLTEVCNFVDVHKGDVFFIKSGTLHAIGAGILIAEVQQNTTYRVSDYGRLGADGKPRALHIDKAVDVTVTAPPSVPYGDVGEKTLYPFGISRTLAECDKFTAELLELDGIAGIHGDGSFVSAVVLDGEAAVSYPSGNMTVKKGDSLFIPANLKVTVSGTATILCSHL